MGRGCRRRGSAAANPAGTAAGAPPRTPYLKSPTRVDAGIPSGEHREPAWNYGTPALVKALPPKIPWEALALLRPRHYNPLHPPREDRQ